MAVDTIFTPRPVLPRHTCLIHALIPTIPAALPEVIQHDFSMVRSAVQCLD